MAGRRTLIAVAAALAAASTLSACGSESIDVAAEDPDRRGAQLFSDNCAGCHTLSVTGSQGSANRVRNRELVDGPNFDTRKETVAQVLYAIRKGGYSGAIMPQNIVAGADAQAVARFLAKYSSRKANIKQQ